jgi:glycosyltransferase involved in cell wall biosynthesis
MFWQGLWFDFCLAERNLYAYALTSIPKEKIICDLWVANTIEVPIKLPILKSKKQPVIVHAPSNLQKKGTHYIQKAVDTLLEEGLSFDFRIFHKIPHEEFIRYMIDEADIVVDQLLIGDFGVLAMEAMTFSKPVCGFVLDELREMIPDLPIVQCTVDTIKDQLRDLILNPKKREQLGRKGWEFAKKHYDRDTTYEKLWQIYLELWNK